MADLSPEVNDRDLTNLVYDLGDNSSISQTNNTLIVNSVKHKSVDEYITSDSSVTKSCYSNHQASNNILSVFHQNIRGLRYKTDELLSALYPDFPHVLCLTEHHMDTLDFDLVTIDHFNLGAVYCRNTLSKGGVCIFVHNSLNFSNINLDRFCIDQTIEICAIKLSTSGRSIYIVAVYRAPTGNFLQFLNTLDSALNAIYCPNVEFIICGDINIDYLKDSSRKRLLNTLLLSFNLFSIIDFPTRSQKNSISLIDNIFIDNSHSGKYWVYPIINALSDHDAQILIIKTNGLQIRNNRITTRRIFSDQNVINFKMQLSFETWDDVFNCNDVNTIFNCFLNTYLRIFNSNFPQKKYLLLIGKLITG